MTTTEVRHLRQPESARPVGRTGARPGGLLRAARRRVLTPSPTEADLDVRGFDAKDHATRLRLEKIGQTFLQGFGEAVESRWPIDAERALETVEPDFRGFAYEGAGMGFAVLDAMSPGPRTHVRDFLAGRGSRHVYMAYVGVGWALPRLPRPLWRRATAGATDPLLRWLVLDGYGFHQAYFQTERFVRQRHRVRNFPWPPEGPVNYASRVIDQGVGRATWFVAGADPGRAADIVDAFAPDRQPDLYAGIGLAATYAQGATKEELKYLAERAGAYRRELAQGSCFAAAARRRAGLVSPGTELATQVICGFDVDTAATIAEGSRRGFAHPNVTAYEAWRQRIMDAASSEGGFG